MFSLLRDSKNVSLFLRPLEEVNRFCVPLAFSHRVDTADQKYTEWSFMSKPCNEAAICTWRFLIFKKKKFKFFLWDGRCEVQLGETLERRRETIPLGKNIPSWKACKQIKGPKFFTLSRSHFLYIYHDFIAGSWNKRAKKQWQQAWKFKPGVSKLRSAGQQWPSNWLTLHGPQLVFINTSIVARHTIFNQTSWLCNFFVHLAALRHSQMEQIEKKMSTHIRTHSWQLYSHDWTHQLWLQRAHAQRSTNSARHCTRHFEQEITAAAESDSPVEEKETEQKTKKLPETWCIKVKCTQHSHLDQPWKCAACPIE